MLDMLGTKEIKNLLHGIAHNEGDNLVTWHSLKQKVAY